jgi:membrane protein DedA with SNARE-associated domain
MDLTTLALICGAAAVQEDLACIGTGLAVARGDVAWAPAMLMCMAGTCIADLFWFLTGKLVGRPALRMPPACWLLSGPKVEAAISRLSRRGVLVVPFSRFTPGLRTALQFGAGLTGLRVGPTVLLVLLASAIYVPLVFLLAYWVGQSLLDRWSMYRNYGLAAAVITAVVVLVALKLAGRLFAPPRCEPPADLAPADDPN